MNRRAATAVLALGFAFTGFGCALPGVLLPALLPLWHWDDQQAGRFFLILAFSSAAGPLCLGSQLRRAVLLGFASVTLAAVAWCVPGLPHAAFGVLWGLGLGMIMTSISLMTSRLATNPAAALVRINFLWAVGACLCPLLVMPALSRFGVPATLRGCAVVALVLAVISSRVPVLEVPPAYAARSSGALRLPAALMAAAALATGIEASAGAWLATWAERFGHGAHATITLPFAFWGGLLLSRAIPWRPATARGQALCLRLLFVLTACASLVLLFPHRAAVPAAAAFALGFGLGPVFPELVARVLAIRQTRSVFFLAGITSAVLPWATGLLSQYVHSLLLGMVIPCLGAAALLFTGWRATELNPAKENMRRAG